MQRKGQKLRDLVKSHPPIVFPGDTVQTAANRMAKAKTSAICVLKGGRLVGILTDGDITEKVVAPGLDAAFVTVGELMNTDPVRICEDRDIESAALVMLARGARALAVQDFLGQFIGILTDRELCQEAHSRSLEITP